MGDFTIIPPTVLSEQNNTLTFSSNPCQRGELQALFLKLKGLCECIVGKRIVTSPYT